MRAISPLARPSRREGRELDERRYFVADVFRLAQVFFDLYGRTLPVRIPGPSGIAHGSYPRPFHIVGWSNIYTIHDLIPLTAPGMTPINPMRHRRLMGAIVRIAAGLVTVSSTSRREIEDTIPLAGIPVVDCGQPVDMNGPIDPLPNGLLSDRYFLVVGSVEARKNIPAIIAAHRLADTGLPLIIVGPDGSGAAAIASLIDGKSVIRLPHMPRPTVRALLAHARALLMVSLAEGFGLPIAEAMALGTPVITSQHGALAETAGGAGLLVDPKDIPAIAAAIRLLDTDDLLRRRLRGDGLIRARTFAPSNFVERLGQFYEDMLQRS